MENSLTLQSRRLIEKLSEKNIIKLHEKKSFKNNENYPTTNSLLNHENNSRQIKCTEANMEHRISESLPKSSMTSIVGRSGYLSKSDDLLSSMSSLTTLSDYMPRRLPFGMSHPYDQTNKDLSNFKTLKDGDLLGYDWIVGMMENKSKESQLDKPVEYFDELDRFRRMNKQYCISSDNRQPAQSNTNTNDYKRIYDNFNHQIQSSKFFENTNKTIEDQPRVYAYTLNERLFPVPLDLETAERGLPDSNNPHIIKVSIPSNRFIHRNHKIESVKDKHSSMNQNSQGKNIGESLSLSSHCQPSSKVSVPISQNDKLGRKLNSSRQEPAGLLGNLTSETSDLDGGLSSTVLSYINNQPKTEQEAIDQLKRGKTGAKLCRLVPSSLENRSFNIDAIEAPSNICQTRITLKDLMDDSSPRDLNTLVSKNFTKTLPLDINCNEPCDIPRPSLSRKEMSRVYGNAMQSVWDHVISNE